MKKIVSLIAIILIANQIGFGQEEMNFQNKIDQALGQSFQSGENKLLPIIATLKSMNQDADQRYWLSFAYFRASLVELGLKHEEKAEAYIDLGISLLDDAENLDAESHALLGNMQGYSIKFNSWSAISLSGKSESHFKQSLKQDPENVRAYVGLASNDFYAPSMFGGGKKVEEYAKKALALPALSGDGKNVSWGRDEAYWLLISFYQREERTEDAKRYFIQAIKEFPYNGRIIALKASI